MRAFRSAIALWSAYMRSKATAWCWRLRHRGTSRCSAPKSSARQTPTRKTRKQREFLYYLIYRLPDGDFPEPGWSIPVGGLVVPLSDQQHVKEVGEQRYHRAPYEVLWFEDVSHMRAGRQQACELQWIWELEMEAWMEAVNG